MQPKEEHRRGKASPILFTFNISFSVYLSHIRFSFSWLWRFEVGCWFLISLLLSCYTMQATPRETENHVSKEEILHSWFLTVQGTVICIGDKHLWRVKLHSEICQVVYPSLCRMVVYRRNNDAAGLIKLTAPGCENIWYDDIFTLCQSNMKTNCIKLAASQAAECLNG